MARQAAAGAVFHLSNLDMSAGAASATTATGGADVGSMAAKRSPNDSGEGSRVRGMARAGAGLGLAATASGAVFRSEPTTMAVMTAAHQTAMEAVARVERFGMTGMAVTRNWNLALPSAKLIQDTP